MSRKIISPASPAPKMRTRFRLFLVEGTMSRYKRELSRRAVSIQISRIASVMNTDRG